MISPITEVNSQPCYLKLWHAPGIRTFFGRGLYQGWQSLHLPLYLRSLLQQTANT